MLKIIRPLKELYDDFLAVSFSINNNRFFCTLQMNYDLNLLLCLALSIE